MLVPTTNVVAEDELNAMRPPTVSLHAARYHIGGGRMDSAEGLVDVLTAVDTALPSAAHQLRAVEPCGVIHIMSAHSFRRDPMATADVAARLEQDCGVPVTDGPRAIPAALGAVRAHHVALLTPYHDDVDAAVVTALEGHGIEVVARTSLCASSTRAVAGISRAAVIDAVDRLATSRADAIVQVGGNLRFARLAAAAESWLGVAVLAANTMLLWHALRGGGVRDQVPGWGSLLEEH
jgi:maleate isomerase